MYKTGKFYVKLAVPDGIAFPTHTSIEVGSLFHKNDEGLLYIYSGEWRPIPVYTGTPSIGDAIRWNGEYWIPSGISASGGGGVVSAFLDLTDVPDTYVGSGGYTVTVKDDETGLEFSAGGALSGTFISLTDTPANYSSYSGYLVIVNDDEDLLIFSTNVPGHDHTGDAGDGGQLDHGATLTGLGDDDHIQYLLATGAREGASTEAQSFGANGILADQIDEDTAAAGVTIDSVWFKDGLIRGGTLPGCKAKRTTQSIPDATVTKFLFTTADEWDDPGNMHSTVTNPSRITVTAGYGGRYLITGSAIALANNNPARVYWILYKNNNAIAQSRIEMGGALSFTQANTITYMEELAVNDYVELALYQDSGGAINWYGDLAIARIGD